MLIDDKRLAAREILEQIDMPRGQLNDRSAWTLLALGDLTPDRPWADTASPIMGLHPSSTGSPPITESAMRRTRARRSVASPSISSWKRA